MQFYVENLIYSSRGDMYNNINLTSSMATVQEILFRERRDSNLDVKALTDFIYTPTGAQDMKRLADYAPHKHDLNMMNKSRVELIKLSIQEHKQHFSGDAKQREMRFTLPFVMKSSMQWPLTIHSVMFVKCIEMLGTQVQQKEWFEKAFNYQIFGCYAQTELGHGSDVQNLQTTATYVIEDDTFIINTPSVQAAKFWPGDMGIWATHAIVFAQMIIRGKNHGVHSFIVPIRDPETFQALPGIEVGDIGPKFGFHTKDNGYLLMNNIVIPKRNMLRKFISVSKTGQIKKKGDPKISYATMMVIRQHLSCVSPRVYGQVITIAVRYSLFRTQFLNAQKIEIPIIDYITQKDKIINKIAEYVALCIAGKAVKDVSDRNLSLVKEKKDFSLMGESHACLCLGKALFSEITYDGMQVCRKSCGGHGFSQYSALPGLQTQFACNLTLEGENTIMYLQVTRYLLKNYKYAMTKKKELGGESVYYLLKANQYMQKRIDNDRADWKRWTIEDIHTLMVQAALYSLSLVTEKMMNKEEGQSQLDIWNNVAGCDIKRAAICHGLLYMFTYFKEAVEKDKSQTNKEVINNLCMLFGSNIILKNAAPLIEGGFIIPDHLSALSRFKQILLQNIRPHIVKIVDAFSIPEQYIQSALTQGDPYENYLELARQNELNQKVQESALIIRKHIQEAITKNQAITQAKL